MTSKRVMVKVEKLIKGQNIFSQCTLPRDFLSPNF